MKKQYTFVLNFGYVESSGLSVYHWQGGPFELYVLDAGRFKKEHGIHSGEAFKELIAKKLQENDTVTVLLNDTMGFGSSWIEEAFGGLVRDNTFSAYDLHKKLTIEADDKSLITEAWSYIDG